MNHISCPFLQFSSNIPSLLDTSRIGALRHFSAAKSLLHCRRVYYISYYPSLQTIHYTKILLDKKNCRVRRERGWIQKVGAQFE